MKRLISSIFLIIFGSLMIIVVLKMPPVGDPIQPGISAFVPDGTEHENILYKSQSTALYYNRNAAYDTGALDIITAIIFDYRGYDTLFETIVLFTALICVLSILSNDDKKKFKSISKFKSSIPTENICHLMIPFVLMFSFSIIFHGHLTPGGGFQGGVIIASVFILLVIIGNKEESRKILSKRQIKIFLVIGLFIYIGIGLIGLFLNKNFLANRSIGFPPIGQMGELFSGGTLIWINMGVGLTVSGIIIQIFYAFIEN